MAGAKNILSATGAATSAMTLFSEVVSMMHYEDFNEAERLKDLIERARPDQKGWKAKGEGWLIHYSVGALFIFTYFTLFDKKLLRPNAANAAMLGAISGLIGIAGWHTALSLHPKPPKIDLKKYYAQLLIAHVIFAAAAVRNYKKRAA